MSDIQPKIIRNMKQENMTYNQNNTINKQNQKWQK